MPRRQMALVVAEMNRRWGATDGKRGRFRLGWMRRDDDDFEDDEEDNEHQTYDDDDS